MFRASRRDSGGCRECRGWFVWGLSDAGEEEEVGMPRVYQLPLTVTVWVAWRPSAAREPGGRNVGETSVDGELFGVVD